MNLMMLVVLGGLLSPESTGVDPYRESTVHLLAQGEVSPQQSTQFRIDELETRIRNLNERSRALSVNFPTGTVVMAYFGGACIFVAVELFALSGLTSITAAPFILVLAMGGVGIALLVTGLVLGFIASGNARIERDRLVRERMDYERELNELKTVPPPAVLREAVPRLITVARF